jgi:hypothetical protein
MIRILIAVPHGGTVEPDTLVSIYNMEVPSGVETELRLFYSYAIDIGRNTVSKHAIENGFTHVFFVDADMDIPKNALTSLLSRRLPIVSGVYIKKQDAVEIVAMKKAARGEFSPVSSLDLSSGSILQVDIIGLGCALIETSVLSRMGHPQFNFADSEDPKKRQGEDVYFCMKAASLYYKIGLDSDVRCGHIGRKRYTI